MTVLGWETFLVVAIIFAVLLVFKSGMKKK